MRTTSFFTAALISALLVATPALANGYLFFHEHQLDEEDGTVYLGFVKDPSGKPLPGAQVSINVVPFNQSIVVSTDARGRYRSEGVSKKIDPRQVKVTVAKRGYQLVRAVNMSRAMKPGLPVEINFTLAARQ
jgi:hypothetical protein